MTTINDALCLAIALIGLGIGTGAMYALMSVGFALAERIEKSRP